MCKLTYGDPFTHSDSYNIKDHTRHLNREVSIGYVRIISHLYLISGSKGYGGV